MILYVRVGSKYLTNARAALWYCEVMVFIARDERYMLVYFARPVVCQERVGEPPGS